MITKGNEHPEERVPLYKPEQKLKKLEKKIALLVCEYSECYGTCMFYRGKGTACQNPVPSQILALVDKYIKEAFPELAKEAGYVKLADDQSLPTYPPYQSAKELSMLMNTHKEQYKQAQRDMLEAGWRKVILEEGK